jgi:alpha-L-fucosidase 2
MLDEVYHEVDGHRLALDVRVPEGPGPFPVVVIVHGGGFSSGDKSEGTAQVWGEYLPTVGFASVSVNYRLSGGMNGGARFPGPLQDVKCAVRWVRSRTAQLRLDADAIFSFGHSAGGYFATALATTGNTDEFDTSCPTASSADSSVAAAVDYYGVTDFSTLASQRSQGVLNNAEQTLVGAACLPGNDTAACRVASPLTHFDAEDPPIFALHADNDTTVPVEQSHQLRDEAGRLGVPFEYLEVQEFGHGWAKRFSHPVIADARDQVVAWLRSR